MRPWVERHGERIAARAARDLEALVAVSSPSGDVEGAEECVALVGALAPPEAEIERLPCSSPGHAEDVVLRLGGGGERRLLLLGHLDTVIDHESHRPLERDGGRLVGSGAVDMKGGDVLALGVLGALAERADDYAEVALLLVTDEEWRPAPPPPHVEAFAGFDACLCFEAGQRVPAHAGAAAAPAGGMRDGLEAAIVRRKAAATLRVRAEGRAAHSGAAPERGRNALLALAAAAAAVAAANDPGGPDELTAVPTILRSGDAFNVVPGDGELYCDLRASRTGAFDDVLAAVPDEVGGAKLTGEFVRRWPAMDSRAATAPLLAAAGERLGRPIAAAGRGGASDASHFATAIALTIDGLGPRGGGAHARDEFVLADSLRSRAEVALAVADAALADR